MCVQVPREAKKELHIPWSWSYKMPKGFWERNSGSLQEQQVLLIDEPHLQPEQRLSN